jgi:hypothetical protein
VQVRFCSAHAVFVSHPPLKRLTTPTSHLTVESLAQNLIPVMHPGYSPKNSLEPRCPSSLGVPTGDGHDKFRDLGEHGACQICLSVVCRGIYIYIYVFMCVCIWVLKFCFLTCNLVNDVRLDRRLSHHGHRMCPSRETTISRKSKSRRRRGA